MAAQIFIVEAYPAVLSGYAMLLQRAPDLAVCGAAVSGEEALTLIPDCQPDLALVDLCLPGMDGLILIAHLYQAQPALPIVIVSSHERMAYVMRTATVLLPSVKSYLHNQAVPHRLVATMQWVLAAGSCLTRSELPGRRQTAQTV
jgi:DNA-binding NarL/FixJ family response regulator